MKKLSAIKKMEISSDFIPDVKLSPFTNDVKRFMKYIFNSVQDGISILDTNLNIIAINHVMKEWYKSKREILNKKCYEVYHGKNRPCNRCPSLIAIKEKHMVKGIVPFDSDNHSKGWQQLYCFPLFSDDGKVEGVVEYVRDITWQKKIEKTVDQLKKRLKLQSKTIEEKNIAIKVLLNAHQENKKEIAENIVSNINYTINPLITQLKNRLRGTDLFQVAEILETTLKRMIFPLVKEYGLENIDLTLRELQVLRFIMEGKTSKEIASLLGLSTKGIEFHRYNIRRKLGLANTGISLQKYLCNKSERYTNINEHSI